MLAVSSTLYIPSRNALFTKKVLKFSEIQLSFLHKDGKPWEHASSDKPASFPDFAARFCLGGKHALLNILFATCSVRQYQLNKLDATAASSPSYPHQNFIHWNQDIQESGPKLSISKDTKQKICRSRNYGVIFSNDDQIIYDWKKGCNNLLPSKFHIGVI